MDRENTPLLPETGLITCADLAKFLNIGPIILRKKLESRNVVIFKVGQRYENWLVSLDQIWKLSGGDRK